MVPRAASQPPPASKAEPTSSGDPNTSPASASPDPASTPRTPVSPSQLVQGLAWRRPISPDLVETRPNRKTCGGCAFLHASPRDVFKAKLLLNPDEDLPCTHFGNRAEFRACDAYQCKPKPKEVKR